MELWNLSKKDYEYIKYRKNIVTMPKIDLNKSKIAHVFEWNYYEEQPQVLFSEQPEPIRHTGTMKFDKDFKRICVHWFSATPLGMSKFIEDEVEKEILKSIS